MIMPSETEKPNVPELSPADMFSVLFMSIAMHGGKFTVPVANLVDFPKDAKVLIEYDPSTQYYTFIAVRTEQPKPKLKLVVPDRKLILPDGG